jgi:hypothetical protein
MFYTVFPCALCALCRADLLNWSKESTPIEDPVVFYGEGRGLALTPKDFYAKAGMIFLFKEISF